MASAVSPSGTAFPPPGTLLTFPGVSLSSPFGKFAVHLSAHEATFVAKAENTWHLPWSSVHSIFCVPDAEKGGQFLVLHCLQRPVQAKGTRGKAGWRAYDALVIRENKLFSASDAKSCGIRASDALPGGDLAAALRRQLDRIGSGSSSWIEGFLSLLRTIPALESAPVYEETAAPLTCSHANESGFLFLLAPGLLFLPRFFFLPVSAIRDAQMVVGISLVSWTVSSSDGSKAEFFNVPREQSQHFDAYLRQHGAPCTRPGEPDVMQAELSQASQPMNLNPNPSPHAFPPQAQQSAAAAAAAAAASNARPPLAPLIPGLHLHTSAMHPASSQQRVILFDDMRDLLIPPHMSSKVFDQEWKMYEGKAAELATTDPNGPAAIAEQRELDAWEQAIAGLAQVRRVVGPYGFYVFVRWFHHHRGASHPLFREAWFDTEEHVSAVLRRFDLELSTVVRKCRPYLARLNLRQHILPVHNNLHSPHHQSEEFIRQQLSARIIGQELAVQATAKALLNLVSPLNPPDRPERILYAGPASTGKTELARAAAKELGVHDSPAFVTVLGSQLANEWDRSKVDGSAPGLVGAEAPTMFKALQQAVAYRDAVGPHCFIVVFIDEAHKIHPVIQAVLREFMYEGWMGGSTGGRLDLGRNFLVIQASNWADQSIQQYWRQCERRCPPDSLYHLQELIREAMRAGVVEGPTAGRYGTIVPFLPLTEEQTICALRLMLAGKTFGWKRVDLPDAMLQWMYRELYDADLGLRHLHDSHLLDALNTLLRSPTPLKDGETRQTVVVVEWNEAEQKATSVAIPPQTAAELSAAPAPRKLQCWQPVVPLISPSPSQSASASLLPSGELVRPGDGTVATGSEAGPLSSPTGIPHTPTLIPAADVLVYDELFRAAARNDVECIRHGHLQSRRMNFADPLGLTLLDAAALSGGIDVLSYLVKHQLIDLRAYGVKAIKNVCSNRVLVAKDSMRSHTLLQMFLPLPARQVNLRLKMAQVLLQGGVELARCEDFEDPLFLVLLWCDPAADETHHLLRTLLQHGHPLLLHHWPLIKARGIPREVYLPFIKQNVSTLCKVEDRVLSLYHWRAMDALAAVGVRALKVGELTGLLNAALHDELLESGSPDWALSEAADKAVAKLVEQVVSHLPQVHNASSCSGSAANGMAEEVQDEDINQRDSERETQQLASLALQEAASDEPDRGNQLTQAPLLPPEAPLAECCMEVDSASDFNPPRVHSARPATSCQSLPPAVPLLAQPSQVPPRPSSAGCTEVTHARGAALSPCSLPLRHSAAVESQRPAPTPVSSAAAAAAATESSAVNLCPCASHVRTQQCASILDLPWDDPVSHHAFLPLASSVLQRVCHHLAPAQFGVWFAALQRSPPSARALQLDEDASLDLALHAATKWGIRGDAELRTVREIKSHLFSFLK